MSELANHERKINPIYRFYFSAHRTEADITSLEEEIRATDVICLCELVGHTRRVQQQIESIHQQDNISATLGTIQRSNEHPHNAHIKKQIDAKSGKYIERVLSLSSKHHKPIVVVDVPSSHQLFGKLVDALFASFSFHSAREFIVGMKKKLKKIAELELEREVYIEKKFISLTQRKAFSELHNGRVKVLVLLGAAHTGIYHRSNFEKTRKMEPSPFVYDITGEIIRKYIFDKSVTDVDVLRLGLRNLLHGIHGGALNDYKLDVHSQERWYRKVVLQFTKQEIASILNTYSTNKDKANIMIAELMKRKNISTTQFAVGGRILEKLSDD